MNKNQIIKMLEYCGLSYSDIQPQGSYEKIVTIDDKKTDVQCYLRIRDGTLIIAFRGSDSQKDWKADFEFWKTSVPYGNFSSKIKVHSGFIRTYKSPKVRGTIHSLINDSIKKIQITGHSYGAALAILCAVDLEYNFPDKDYEVIVFGCPRVGNKAFQKSYNKRIFKTLRVENKNDIVTKIPWLLLGYRHVGAKLKLGKRGILKFYSSKAHNLHEYYSNIWDV